MNKNLIRQAQQMQAQLAKAQEELESATVEGSSGGGVEEGQVLFPTLEQLRFFSDAQEEIQDLQYIPFIAQPVF